jgi:Flp pilus assembly protein TadD
VELAKQAVAAQPEGGSCCTTLGVARYRAGDWKAARDALQKALERGQGGGNIYWFGRTTLFLAMSHWKLGDQEKARTHYQQAVKWMAQNRSELEKDKGRWNELRRFRAEAESVLAQSPDQGKK